MPYITIMQSPAYHQISFEEIISGEVNMQPMITSNNTNTRTYFAQRLKPQFLERFDFAEMVTALEIFCAQNAGLYTVPRGG